MRFQLSHTHAYPGCRVTIAEEDVGDENLVEFSDGVIAACRHRRDGPLNVLTIAAYRTSRGTEIGEKSWILLPDTTKGDWKIKAQAPGAAATGARNG